MVSRFSDLVVQTLKCWLTACIVLLSGSYYTFSQQTGSAVDGLEIPLLEEESVNLSERDYDRIYLKYSRAKSAADIGLDSLALDLVEELLNEEVILFEDFNRQLESLAVRLYLDKGQVDEAESYMERLSEDPNSEYFFLSALIEYWRGDFALLEENLSAVEFEDLTSNDQAWFYFLLGVVASNAGDNESSIRAFDSALDSAQNASQLSHLNRMIWRDEILSGSASDELEVSLKVQIENAIYPVIASQLVQQYAIVLVAMGRTDEAVLALENQNALLSDEFREQKDRLLMMISILAGGGKSRLAIENILLEGEDTQIREMAFYYRLQDFGDEPQDDFLEVLGRILERNPEDMLRDPSWYLFGLEAYENGELDEAESWANELFQNTEDSGLEMSSLRLLAAIYWSRQPPQYRIAAERLIQLDTLIEDDTERLYNRKLIGDSYYFNGDYLNAFSYYDPLLENADQSEFSDQLIYKMIDSLIQLNQMERAETLLGQRFLSANEEAAEFLWAAEWNYVINQINLGNIDSVKARVQMLWESFEYDVNTPWQLIAHLRLGWLNAYLNYNDNNPDQVIGILDQLLSLEQLQISDNDLIRTVVYPELLILKARTLLQTGQVDEAFALFDDVRVLDVIDKAALTYLIEARYYGGQGDSLSAQRSLVELADKYPQSVYAPVALYEAALSVESRNTRSSDQEAIRIYSRIAEDFSEHSLAFIAKLKQGDILRKSNNFVVAAQFYEQMINDFPDESRIHLAEIALAESYFALGSTNQNYIEQAFRIFEQLLDISTIPIDLRLEAGTKAALALKQLDVEDRFVDVLWRVVNQVIGEDTESLNLGVSGRYWLARAVVELSDVFQNTGENEQLNTLYELSNRLGLPAINIMRNRL